MAVADFDGDATPEVALAHRGGVRITRRVGNRLQFVAELAADPDVSALAAGDLTGDGLVDLVGIEAARHTLVLWEGVRPGLFAEARRQQTLGSVTELALTATATGLGVVAVGSFDSGVEVFRVDGAGTMARTARLLERIEVTSLAFARLDGSPGVDLLVGDGRSGEGRVVLFPGRDDGTFGVEATLFAGGRPRRTVVADLDADGRDDVATLQADGRLSVRLGLAQGGVSAPRSVLLGFTPTTINAADLSGDGRLDLLTTSAVEGLVNVRRGDGSGGFDVGWVLSVPTPRRHTLLPTDGGVPDLLLSIPDGRVLLVEHPGRLPLGSWWGVAGGIGPGALASLGSDTSGAHRLMVAQSGAGAVDFRHAMPDGYLALAQTAMVRDGPRQLAIGDFDSDGALDVATSHGRASGIALLLGVPGAPVSRSVDVPERVFGLDAADVDGDGRTDLIAVLGDSRRVVRLSGGGDGSFAPPAPIAVDLRSPSSVRTADFDRDGVTDVVIVAEQEPPALALIRRSANGSFGTPTRVPLDASPLALEMAETDAGGQVAVGDRAGHVHLVSLESGRAEELPVPARAARSALRVIDVDGDDSAEIISASQDGVIDLATRKGDGTWALVTSFSSGFVVRDLLVVDVTGDGRSDLVLSHPEVGYLGVVAGRCIP